MKKRKGREKKKKTERKSPVWTLILTLSPSPPIKTTLKKPTSRTSDQNTDQKRMKENISNKVQLFLFGNNNKKIPLATIN